MSFIFWAILPPTGEVNADKQTRVAQDNSYYQHASVLLLVFQEDEHLLFSALLCNRLTILFTCQHLLIQLRIFSSLLLEPVFPIAAILYDHPQPGFVQCSVQTKLIGSLGDSLEVTFWALCLM